MIEFIVPIFLDKEIISFLVCGQILDKKPTKSDWLKVRQLLQEKSINVESLEELYYNVNIISHRIQKDLMAQLQLFGNYIAYSQNQILIMKEDHCTQIAVRAESFIRNHFQEQITLRDVADAAYTSARNLRRVFRLETGKTVWEYLHGIRIAFACEQLLSTDKTCSQIAFDCGFGSIQQFNLVFRKMKKITPLEWRKRMR
jgi:AraC-like DNA-binding protein